MATIHFTVLGSSAGMPQPDRGNSGYVLDIDGGLIQFDCGGGISREFRRAGFDPMNVERIFISHTHPDHVCDLPLYVQMLYLAGRRKPLTIHIAEEALAPIRTGFQAMYLIEQKLPFDLLFTPITEGETITSDKAAIRPVANSHLDKYAPFVKKYELPNKQQSYSFLIEAGGKKMLYSADLGSEKDILSHLKGLDLLIVESTHIDLQAVLEKASAEGVGRIVLTHIEEDYDSELALTAAKKLGLENVSVAEDGIRFRL